MPGGNGAVTFTPVAFDSPKFATFSVYVQSAWIAGGTSPVEMVTAKSAAGFTVTVALAVLLVVTGSVFSPWIEKLLVSVPAAAAWGMRTTVTIAVPPTGNGPRSAVKSPSA